MNQLQKHGWEALRILAKQFYQSGRYDEAQMHFASALQEAERFGEHDIRLLTSLTDMADFHYTRGDGDSATQLIDRASTLARKFFPYEQGKLKQLKHKRRTS